MSRPATGQVIKRKGKHGTTFALRFRAYGKRRFVTLGTTAEGWDRRRAESELANVLTDVRRGVWVPSEPEPVAEEPQAEPTFHKFASEWLDSRSDELAPRTVEDYTWALSNHLLPFFASHRLSDITIEEVDRYRAVKVRERRAIEEAHTRKQRLDERGLSNSSINKTLTRLAQILEVAVEYGHLASNPAHGRRRRLKTDKPRRAWMEAEQVRALFASAGKDRALLKTAIMAGGLRVSELCDLRWRNINLANGRLSVESSKTEAGIREIDLASDLGAELRAHKASSCFPEPDDFVFPTERGTRQDRNNVRRRVLKPAIERANAKLVKAGREPISSAVTFHSLRHTYASLMAENGADPAYTMAQIGHKDAGFTMSVYTHVGNRTHAANERLGELLSMPDEWAQAGTNAEVEVAA